MRRMDYRYRHRDAMCLPRLLHAFISALIPGAGQLAAGARRRGFIMLGVVVLLLACGVVLAMQGLDQVLSYVVRPRVLLMLLGLNVALLAFRLFAVLDAYRAGGVRSREATEVSRLRVAAGRVALALLLFLTVAPHGITGYYIYLSHDLLTGVFAGKTDVEPRSTSDLPSMTTPPSPPALTSTTWTTPTSQPTPISQTTSTAEAPPDTAPDLEWGEDQRLTILLIGTDAGYGRRGARADSIMVVTLGLQEGYVALFGIPRNTGDLPLSGRTAKAFGTRVYSGMISDLYQDAWDQPQLAPEGGDPGAVVLREVASTLLGIPVDHYAVIDMGGFVDLVDAFGGITLNVKERVHVRLSPPTKGEEYRIYDILPGKRQLDGHEALAFARSRTGNSDYDRMRRQRCVLKALLYQNGATELALKFPNIVQVIRDNLRTDIPVERLPELVKVRAKLKTDQMLTIGFTPPDYITGRNELGYNILDRELVQYTVREIIRNPDRVLETQGSDANVDTSDCWKAD